jgi:hypothetical protein
MKRTPARSLTDPQTQNLSSHDTKLQTDSETRRPSRLYEDHMQNIHQCVTFCNSRELFEPHKSSVKKTDTDPVDLG